MKISSKALSQVALFGALVVACDIVVTPSLSAGIWYGWIFIISPIAGIALGPYNGFISTFIGALIGHSIVPRETIYEFIFALGAPIGSMVSGFIFQKQWKKAFILYTAMFAAYFASPISWRLPIWGIWDTLGAYFVLAILGFTENRRGSDENRYISPYVLSAFVGLEADVLFRIFIFVPAQGYSFFYGLAPEALIAIWTLPAPLITPFKVLLSSLVSKLVGPQVAEILKISTRNHRN